MLNLEKITRVLKGASRTTLVILVAVCLLSLNVSAAYRPVYDFTGDTRTDFTVLTLPTGTGNPITWKFLRNPGIAGPGNAFIRTLVFGRTGDSITAADFSGDSKTEISVRRGTDNLFYTTPFPETTVGAVETLNWGTTGDNIGRDGDYDGDGKDDETIVRIVSNRIQWWYKGSAGTDRLVTYGALATGFSTFIFQGADFTNDGRDEFVIAQVSNSGLSVKWYVGDSITGAPLLEVQWGNFNSDFLINPDDYTGDGIADIPIWRGAATTGTDAGAWYIRNTATGGLVPPVKFGINGLGNGDIPLRGNYDGDSRADIAVFRPSTREWFWINSSTGTVGSQQWGEANDVPLPNFFTF